jgi:signal transduction histidine kinase
MGDAVEHVLSSSVPILNGATDERQSQERLQQIEAEQTRLLYAQAPIAFVVSVVNATILAFFLRHTIPVSTLGAWWMMLIGVYFARLMLVLRYRQATPEATLARYWRTRFLIGAFAAGCAWGTAGIFLFPTQSLPHQVFLTFVIGGMGIGAITSTAAVKQVYWGFILPLTLPLICRFFVQEGELFFAMGLLGLIFVAGVMAMGSQFSAMIMESIALRFEKQDLLQSRNALQISHDVLEDRVRERTAALQQEVRERTRSEAHAQAMLHAIPDTVFRVTRAGVLLDFKPRGRLRSLVVPEQCIGNNVIDVFPLDVAQAITKAVAEVLRTGESQVCEYPLSVQGDLLNYETRLVVSGPDEVMGIVRDITQRKEVERLKDEFISAVSHELRTPLTSLVGFTELMLNRQFPTEKQHQYMSLIHDESVRLAHLVNDLLDLQQSQLGNLTYHFAALDLETLLKKCTTLFEQKVASLRLAIASPLPLVYADDQRIRQVMTNLLSNAVKFSPAEGVMTVGARVQEGAVVTWVADEGAGIPVEAIPKLFERFFRVDNEETRHIGGAGLGLALVKEIVEAHGGRVWVESTLGQGSTFFFTLPLANSRPHVLTNPLAEMR